ncbi:copper resistance CopC family protein [Paenibacillus albus]|uniref:copper resistance CopC family protein n=1 Tax=Paenibacillus albus TaxID=2495582 RepID=UPI0013DF8510|nr:copper resistance CopC family protein [Paenibacillus albus]
MKKRWSLCLFILVLLLLPQTVSAHTAIKASTPANGETVSTELKEITLSFGTEIEPVVVLKVTDSSKKEVPVKAEAAKSTIKGVFEAPLADGTYTVSWRIIGEDGHNITGEYTFNVAVPVQQDTAPVNSTVTADTPEIDHEANAASEETVTPVEQNAAPDSSNASDVVDASAATTEAAEFVLPEEYTKAAEADNKQKNIWTSIIAIAVLGLVFMLFRSVLKKGK